MNRQRYRTVLIVTGTLTTIIGSMLMGFGCSRDEVFSVGQSEQIGFYIEEVEKAQNLFRTEGVFPDNLYQWPGGTAVYRDSVMEVSREWDIYLTDDTAVYDHGNYGWEREGIVHVIDEFTVRVFRMDGNDTTYFDETRTLVRNGFFLKLGDNDQAYAGWELWGVGPGDISNLNMSVGIWLPDGTSIRGDYDHFHERFKGLKSFGSYIKLSDMALFLDTMELVVEAQISDAGIATRFRPSIIRTTADGFQVKAMGKIDLEHFVDTLSIEPYNDPIYDFLIFNLVTDPQRQFAKAWAIPYRALRR